MYKVPVITITSTTRRRKLADGTMAAYPQWYVNYRDPKTNQRIRRAKDRKRDAEEYRNDLLLKFAAGDFTDERKAPTIGALLDHWFAASAVRLKLPRCKAMA